MQISELAWKMMTVEPETIVEIQHLKKKFKKIEAVKDLSLSVCKGDVFGFLGPNGAGKSTTIRIMLDLIRATKGTVKLFGLDLKTNRKKVLKRIGALAEKPDFYSYLTGRKNLELVANMIGEVRRAQIDEILEIVRLKERAKDKVKAYSHGMRQRLGIAQALLGNPELIILDEPTTGLDPAGMKEIRELIQDLSQKNITILLSSHLLHEVEQICNRMAVISKGELIVQGSVQQLLREGPMILVLEVDQIKQTEELLSKLPFVSRVFRDQKLIKVELPYKHIPELNRFLIEQGINVWRLQPQTSLEDYYLSLVQN